MRIKKLKIFLFIIVFILIVSCVGVVIKIRAHSNLEMKLQGKIIFIDCGHGGKDDGASVDGIVEDDVNMKIGGYLFEELIKSGAQVYISRTGDYDLSSMYIKNKKREDLKNRVNYINQIKPDIFISIHLNTFSVQDVKGAQTFYQNNNRSKFLSDCVQKELNILTNVNKKNKSGDYFILNKTLIPGVLVECGFLSNNEERKKLVSDSYQLKIAKALKKGVINYFVNF